jgi:hypothetical protein
MHVSLEAFVGWFTFVFACLSQAPLRRCFVEHEEPSATLVSPSERQQWCGYVSFSDPINAPHAPSDHRVAFPRSLSSAFSFGPFHDSPIFVLPTHLPELVSPGPTDSTAPFFLPPQIVRTFSSFWDLRSSPPTVKDD